jgi:predicted acylesterase/phospholipase RssA
MKTRIRTVCSGGGSKGAFYAGVCKAKKELGIVDYDRWGNSIGSLNLILEGLGYDLEIIWKEKLKLNNIILKMLKAYVSGKDIRSAFSMESIYKELIPEYKDFRELDTPTFIPATDLISGCCYMFGKDITDKLLQAALASSAIPVIFKPVMYRDRLLVDGMLSNNIPLPDDYMSGDIVILTLLCNRDETYVSPEYNSFNPMKKIFAEAVASWETYANQEMIREIPLVKGVAKVILIDMDKYSDLMPIDFSHTEELIELGYNKAKQILGGIEWPKNG